MESEEERGKRLRLNFVRFTPRIDLKTRLPRGKHLILIIDWGEKWANRGFLNRWVAYSNHDRRYWDGGGWGDNPDDAHEALLEQHPEFRGIPVQYL